MEALATWVAPIATALAACMTAANLGARVTGWGFVVFTVGSIAWTVYAATTGQPGLMWQNLFLTAVNVVGVWRWLGRQARIDDGARTASQRSEAGRGPTLFPASSLSGAVVETRGGERLGDVADAMIRCEDGGLEYLVVGVGGVGGVGQSLHALPWKQARLTHDKLITSLDRSGVERLRTLGPDDWPSR